MFACKNISQSLQVKPLGRLHKGISDDKFVQSKQEGVTGPGAGAGACVCIQLGDDTLPQPVVVGTLVVAGAHTEIMGCSSCSSEICLWKPGSVVAVDDTGTAYFAASDSKILTSRWIRTTSFLLKIFTNRIKL